MASPFETAGTFLMQAQADHINQRHVFKQDHVKTAIFRLHLDLVELLKNVSELTWEESENIDVLLEEGWLLVRVQTQRRNRYRSRRLSRRPHRCVLLRESTG